MNDEIAELGKKLEELRSIQMATFALVAGLQSLRRLLVHAVTLGSIGLLLSGGRGAAVGALFAVAIYLPRRLRERSIAMEYAQRAP